MPSNEVPAKGQVDRRIRTRQRIFLAISVALLLFMGYDVSRGYLAWWLAALALLGGASLGYLFGSLGRFAWSEEEEKVVSRMDALGIVIILAYVALALARNFLLHEWFTGNSLTAFSLAAAAGLLFGRYAGTRHSVHRAFRARGDSRPEEPTD